MKTFLRTHFPENSSKWKVYFKVFLPIMLSSTLIALNGFVDNFMVGHISQGVSALSAANSWSNIQMGIITGVAAAGAVVMAQYYHSGNYDKARDIARLRFLLSISITSIMIIFALTMTDQMNKVFLKEPKSGLQADVDNWHRAVDLANSYMRISTIWWFLTAISFNLGNILREIGHARITMWYGMATLGTNIALNAAFMYGAGMEVEGAAWASVAARMVAMTIGITYVIKKKLEIRFNPLTLFNISSIAWKKFFRNWFLFVSFSSTVFFITFRNFFYDGGYPTASIAPGVGGMYVLGLTGAIMNVFTTTFNALAAMAANFVGSELGKGNIEKAKKNSNELKGFNTTISTALSVTLIIVCFIIPYMSFLSEDKNDKIYIDHAAHLENVKWSLMVVAFYYPTWIWFTTSYRNAASGGKGFWFSFVDWFVSGPVQLGQLALMAYVMVPLDETFWNEHFWLFYGIFFLSDFIKMIATEILYYKKPWAFNITKKQEISEKAKAASETEMAFRD